MDATLLRTRAALACRFNRVEPHDSGGSRMRVRQPCGKNGKHHVAAAGLLDTLRNQHRAPPMYEEGEAIRG